MLISPDCSAIIKFQFLQQPHSITD